ncbi:NAC domain-containing protein 17 [Hirschfeldia incana]|nr:NAC domain-containing protein 17 [Hirschfeldia incana]
MHEYTMDEEELGRCKNAKEYYALYKLFKKSGAGPKNGEDYGAPFQEEEWVDDDNEVGDDIAVQEEPVAPYVDNGLLFNPVNLHLDDIEEILSGIPYAPVVPQTCMNPLASNIPQVNSQEALQSTFVNNSAGGFLEPQEIGELLPYNLPSSFESTEVTSAPKMAPFVFEEEDYIEMDDLLTSELGASSTEKPEQFLDSGEFGEFNEFDQLFHDVSMFLDMEPILQEASAGPSLINTSDQEHQLLYQQFQDQTPEDKLNSIMDPNPNPNQLTDDMWFQDDDQALLFDQPQSIISGAFASPSSGVNVMPGSTNITTSVTAQDGGGGTSPFSSALWAFMDSIPSTPASACEGPINRTFVRMSSFSRMRFSGKANGTPATTTLVAKKRSRNRGFLVLSIVGALCAIFWVFIATVRASGRPVFS